MEDRLSSMTQKMLDLQVKYLDLQVKSAEQLSQLHHKVYELSEQRDLRIGMKKEIKIITHLRFEHVPEENCLYFEHVHKDVFASQCKAVLRRP